METNTLVIHKQERFKGIGCVSAVRKSYVTVNHGTSGKMQCKKDALIPVDVSHCKTISFDEYRKRVLLTNSNLNDCIVGNELKHYVGIGWITTRVVTSDDLTKYPRVIA